MENETKRFGEHHGHWDKDSDFCAYPYIGRLFSSELCGIYYQVRVGRMEDFGNKNHVGKMKIIIDDLNRELNDYRKSGEKVTDNLKIINDAYERAQNQRTNPFVEAAGLVKEHSGIIGKTVNIAFGNENVEEKLKEIDWYEMMQILFPMKSLYNDYQSYQELSKLKEDFKNGGLHYLLNDPQFNGYMTIGDEIMKIIEEISRDT